MVSPNVYETLSSSLDKIENKQKIILDRSKASAKAETISYKRFHFFNKKLKALKKNFSATHVTKKNQDKNGLAGEVKLAQLRDIQHLFSSQVFVHHKPISQEDIIDLKNESIFLQRLIDRLNHFKMSLGGDELKIDVLEPKTRFDEEAFHNLHEIIDNLIMRQDVIQAVVKIKQHQPITKSEAYAILFCKGQMDGFVDPELEGAAIDQIESSFRKTG